MKVEEVLIYLHVAKTAGTTMLHYLMRMYPKLIHMKSWWNADWPGIPEDTDCIFSHCPYGLPDRYISGKPLYISFIREPVDRVVSYYYFGIQNFNDPQWLGIALENFIGVMKGKLYASMDNGQTRLFAGRGDIGMMPPISDVGQHDLDTAKRNLRNFAALGTVDTFDHDLERFAKKFGWKSLGYEKQRVGRRPKVDEIGEEFKKLIVENNRYDIELYEYAKEIKDSL